MTETDGRQQFRRWMFEQSLTLADVRKALRKQKCRVSIAAISAYCTGRRRPTQTVALAMEAVSGVQSHLWSTDEELATLLAYLRTPIAKMTSDAVTGTIRAFPSLSRVGE